MQAPTPRSLVLDLLSTLRRGSMPVRALVEAGAVFDIAEGSIRVALARLLAAGRVERDQRGRYRLGASAASVARRVTGWRRLEERTEAWHGRWIACLGGSGRGRARALRFFGFRALERGLELRPANLRGELAELRSELQRLGLPQGALVCELGALDRDRDRRARRLWDADDLVASYSRSLVELAESRERLAQLPEASAMAESFLVGGRVMRQLVLDPVLPKELVPAHGRRQLVQALREYDRIGRACWSGLLARHDVPHVRAPADTRIAEGAGRLVALAGGK